jgi:DNA primase catalytic core, N-terminal domain
MLSPTERKERIRTEIKISQVVNVNDRGSSTCPCCGKSSKFSVQANRGKCWSSYCELNKPQDVISLYQWKHNLADRWEATKAIEQEFNLPVGTNKPNERSLLLEQCLAIYQKYLWANQEALDYLRNRGFLDEVIKDLGLGYAPDFSCLTRQGIKATDLQRESLYEEGKEYYSKRIIFPIRNSFGHLVHFQGRYILPIAKDDKGEDTIPKYKDSKQANNKTTKDFLYLEEHIEKYLKSSKTLYVAEGCPDTISLWQKGLPVVGSLGLEKLTFHCSKLKKFENIVFMFDNDIHPVDHPKYPLEYKSWIRVIPQLIDLQIALPATNFYTCLVPHHTIHKQDKYAIETKDINEWLTVGQLTKNEVERYINSKKKEFVSSLVEQEGSNISYHFNLLKLIQVTGKHYLKEELFRFLPPSKSPIDYACEVLAA